MSKITITIEDTFGGMYKVASSPPAGDIIGRTVSGHELTGAEAMALHILVEARDYAKQKNMVVKLPGQK